MNKANQFKSKAVAYFMLFIVAVALMSSCGKGSSPAPSTGPDPSIVKLLASAPAKMWQINDGEGSSYWDYNYSSIIPTWQLYSNYSRGVYVFSDCTKNNDHIALYPDGTYTQSNYTCDLNAPTEAQFFSRTGSTAQWSLGNDNVTLSLYGMGDFRLISVTASDLVISNYFGTIHYVNVPAAPFLSSLQQLTGTGTKVWKISKITLSGVVQPLTAAQAATLFTFNANGVLTSSFTDVAFGQPATGTWLFQNSSRYVYTFPALGTVAAVNQACSISELTQTSFAYSYANTQGYYYEVYLVPQ